MEHHNKKLRSAHVFALFGITGVLSLLPNTGCLVTTEPYFPPPPNGKAAAGSCMCALCLDKPFCANEDRTDGILMPIGGCGGSFPVEAVPASEVTGLSTKNSTPFFCAPLEDKDVDAPLFCPSAKADRLPFQNVSTCIDVPVVCRTGPEAVGCPELPQPGDPACPTGAQTGAERTVCGVNDPNLEDGDFKAVEKLRGACAIFGESIPIGTKPARYCFLACLDASVCPLIGDPLTRYCDECDATLFDPPEITSTSLLVSVDPTSSVAEMTAILGSNTYQTSVPLDGLIAVELPKDCQGPFPAGQPVQCDARLPLVRLNAQQSFSIADFAISDARLQVPQPIHHTAITRESTTAFTIPTNSTLYVTGEVSEFGVRQAVYPTPSVLGYTIDWQTRQFDMNTVLEDPNGTSTLALTLHGTIPNLGPLAHAGPDQTLECTGSDGAIVWLSSAGSTDPDGELDLKGFVWVSKVNDALRERSGSDIQTTAPVGTTKFALLVSDREGVTDIDSTEISVVDTTPPTFAPIEVATDCLWPPNHKMRLFRLGLEIQAPAVDICDENSPMVRILNVVSNQPENTTGDANALPDVRFGSGAFCIRAERTGNVRREYTVTLEAADASGNSTLEFVTIVVPGAQGGSGMCTTSGSSPVVDESDTRCTMQSAP